MQEEKPGLPRLKGNASTKSGTVTNCHGLQDSPRTKINLKISQKSTHVFVISGLKSRPETIKDNTIKHEHHAMMITQHTRPENFDSSDSDSESSSSEFEDYDVSRMRTKTSSNDQSSRILASIAADQRDDNNFRNGNRKRKEPEWMQDKDHVRDPWHCKRSQRQVQSNAEST